MAERENWVYETKRNGWHFLLSIPDALEPWDVDFIEGIFADAIDQCKRRLKRVAKFDGYEVDEHETTERLLRKLEKAKAAGPKYATRVLAITSAIQLHCA